MNFSSPCWSKYKILPKECWAFKKCSICVSVSAKSSLFLFRVSRSSFEIRVVLCDLISDNWEIHNCTATITCKYLKIFHHRWTFLARKGKPPRYSTCND
jgi:hypothetical protein